MTSKSKDSPTGAGTTASGPSHPGSPRTSVAEHAAQEASLVAAMPFNENKPGEYGYEHAIEPREGASLAMPSPQTGASTLSEANDSSKTGAPALRPMGLDGALTAKRVNDAGQPLTTNQGVAIADNQNSLKAGLRGPTLLEDFILREKITHFDHERIPERIVHARGSGAHGYFENYAPFTKYTKSGTFREKRQNYSRVRSLFDGCW